MTARFMRRLSCLGRKPASRAPVLRRCGACGGEHPGGEFYAHQKIAGDEGLLRIRRSCPATGAVSYAIIKGSCDCGDC